MWLFIRAVFGRALGFKPFENSHDADGFHARLLELRVEHDTRNARSGVE